MAAAPSLILPTACALMEHDDRREPLFNIRVPEGVTPSLDRFYYDLAVVGAAAPAPR